VSPYNLGVLHVDLQGGTIVALHNSGGELSLYTIQGGNCVLKIWVPTAYLFPGMCYLILLIDIFICIGEISVSLNRDAALCLPHIFPHMLPHDNVPGGQT
jgi:hypothetical protein